MLTYNQTQKLSKRHEMPKKSNVWQNGTDLLSILSYIQQQIRKTLLH